jgi:hypothetical protein
LQGYFGTKQRKNFEPYKKDLAIQQYSTIKLMLLNSNPTILKQAIKSQIQLIGYYIIIQIYFIFYIITYAILKMI